MPIIPNIPNVLSGAAGAVGDFVDGAFDTVVGTGKAGVGTGGLAGKKYDPDVRRNLKAWGWPDAEIEHAAGVIYRESRGDCSATNDKNNTPAGSKDRGAFQLNDHWQAQVSDECAYNCECNSKEALKIWQKSGWGPWASSGSTSNVAPAPKNFKFKNDSGGAFSSPAEQGAQAVEDTGIAGALSTIANAVLALFNADTWFRVLKSLSGGLLFLAGVLALLGITLKNTPIPNPVKGVKIAKAAIK